MSLSKFLQKWSGNLRDIRRTVYPLFELAKEIGVVMPAPRIHIRAPVSQAAITHMGKRIVTHKSPSENSSLRHHGLFALIALIALPLFEPALAFFLSAAGDFETLLFFLS